MTVDLTDDTTLKERIAAIRSANKAVDPMPVVDELLRRLSECGKAMHCCTILSWHKDDFDESKWQAMMWVCGAVGRNLKPARTLAEFAIEMDYEKRGRGWEAVTLPDGKPLRKEYGVELRERSDDSSELLINLDASLDTVTVMFEKGATGLYYATSHDLRGLLVTRDNLEALYNAIPQAITDLYKAQGREVTVAELKN